MNNVLKKALGFASALVLSAGMVLAASPVQASDVDARIQVLERELAQLKQNQEVANERALAAEMKGPSFKYSAGKGLTIAAADNNWSIKFGQRLQLYSTFWLSQDSPTTGHQDGRMFVRRFRPGINVTSQQGFYQVVWTFNGTNQASGSDANKAGGAVAFNGDMYLDFSRTNPWLPKVGYGLNPSFGGIKEAGFGRTDGSPMLDAGNVALGSSVDSGFVLSWTKLPAMGTAKITHFELAIGHDERDEFQRSNPHGLSDDGRSMHLAFGIKPLGQAKMMGGVDVSSVKYSFGYVTAGDGYPLNVRIRPGGTVQRVRLVDAGGIRGSHDLQVHGLRWSPMKWFTISVNYGLYEGENDDGMKEAEANETRFAAEVWLWGPKSGMMGGSKKEGGISVRPMYLSGDVTWTGAGNTADFHNYGLSVVYNVPGGWFQIHGVWDNIGCEGNCTSHMENVVADEGDDSFNAFTLIAEYRF